MNIMKKKCENQTFNIFYLFLFLLSTRDREPKVNQKAAIFRDKEKTNCKELRNITVMIPVKAGVLGDNGFDIRYSRRNSGMAEH